MCNCLYSTVLTYANSHLAQTKIIMLVFNSRVTSCHRPSGLKQQPSIISVCL